MSDIVVQYQSVGLCETTLNSIISVGQSLASLDNVCLLQTVSYSVTGYETGSHTVTGVRETKGTQIFCGTHQSSIGTHYLSIGTQGNPIGTQKRDKTPGKTRPRLRDTPFGT